MAVAETDRHSRAGQSFDRRMTRLPFTATERCGRAAGRDARRLHNASTNRVELSEPQWIAVEAPKSRKRRSGDDTVFRSRASSRCCRDRCSLVRLPHIFEFVREFVRFRPAVPAASTISPRVQPKRVGCEWFSPHGRSISLEISIAVDRRRLRQPAGVWAGSRRRQRFHESG